MFGAESNALLFNSDGWRATDADAPVQMTATSLGDVIISMVRTVEAERQSTVISANDDSLLAGHLAVDHAASGGGLKRAVYSWCLINV